MLTMTHAAVGLPLLWRRLALVVHLCCRSAAASAEEALSEGATGGGGLLMMRRMSPPGVLSVLLLVSLFLAQHALVPRLKGACDNAAQGHRIVMMSCRVIAPHT